MTSKYHWLIYLFAVFFLGLIVDVVGRQLFSICGSRNCPVIRVYDCKSLDEDIPHMEIYSQPKLRIECRVIVNKLFEDSLETLLIPDNENQFHVYTLWGTEGRGKAKFNSSLRAPLGTRARINKYFEFKDTYEDNPEIHSYCFEGKYENGMKFILKLNKKEASKLTINGRHNCPLDYGDVY